MKSEWTCREQVGKKLTKTNSPVGSHNFLCEYLAAWLETVTGINTAPLNSTLKVNYLSKVIIFLERGDTKKIKKRKTCPSACYFVMPVKKAVIFLRIFLHIFLHHSCWSLLKMQCYVRAHLGKYNLPFDCEFECVIK